MLNFMSYQIINYILDASKLGLFVFLVKIYIFVNRIIPSPNSKFLNVKVKTFTFVIWTYNVKIPFFSQPFQYPGGFRSIAGVVRK